MKQHDQNSPADPGTLWASSLPTRPDRRLPLYRLGIALAILLIAFSRPLLALVQFALSSELYSHVLLIPFVSLYMAFIQRDGLAKCEFGRGRGWALGVAGLAMLPLAGWWGLAWESGSTGSAQDALFLSTSSFLLLSMAAGFWFLGRRFMSQIALPLTVLMFTAPFPTAFEHAVEVFFQHASAESASVLFQISRVPLVRESLFFHLPHITLEVARECSGIRSSLVLFITSLVAGGLFLRSPWRRSVLAAAVIPLAILRNALRIFTIGMLCVHVDPAMIHSWVHVRGGPLFFLLSLVPFFALLLGLRASEKGGIVSPEAARPTGFEPNPGGRTESDIIH
ncbi:MAG: archaeosortase/exosortase family protein [Verrucomicrobiia bacterium]